MADARYDDDKELDEFVADDVASVHLERMNEGSWWMGIEHTDGTVTHINLAARSPSVTKVLGTCNLDA